MEFKDQIANAKVTHVKAVRTFIQWDNTEVGRDIKETYERVQENGVVYFQNQYNRNIKVTRSNPFWQTLEDLFQELNNK